MFGTAEELAGLDFMEEYLTKYSSIDRTLKNQYGFMYPYEQYETEAETFEEFQENVFALLETYEQPLQRLWDMYVKEYDPLVNWSKHEEEDTEQSGADVKIDNLGQRQITQVNGAQITQVDYGQQRDDQSYGATQETTQFGAVHSEDEMGAVADTISRSRASINTSPQEYTPTDKEVDSKSQHADKHDINQHSDIVSEIQHADYQTRQAHTDVRSHAAYTDINTQAAAQDRSQMNYGKGEHRELESEGNVGTMMAQQMAQAEIDLWNGFNFYVLLFKLILKTLCFYHDEGCSTFRRGCVPWR